MFPFGCYLFPLFAQELCQPWIIGSNAQRCCQPNCKTALPFFYRLQRRHAIRRGSQPGHSMAISVANLKLTSKLMFPINFFGGKATLESSAACCRRDNILPLYGHAPVRTRGQPHRCQRLRGGRAGAAGPRKEGEALVRGRWAEGGRRSPVAGRRSSVVGRRRWGGFGWGMRDVAGAVRYSSTYR